MIFDKKFQEKMQTSYHDDLREQAWRTFCQCDYYGTVIENVEKTLAGYRTDIDKLKAEHHEIELGKDSHSKENREKKNGIMTRINNLEARIERAKPEIAKLREIYTKHFHDAKQFANMAGYAKIYKVTETEAPGEEEKKEKVQIEVVEAPGDLCGNTKKLENGEPCPGCRACK